MLLLLATTAAVKAGDFTYTTNPDNTITITRYNGFDDTVIIPSAIDGKTVAGIGYKAFSSCTSLSAITVDAGNAVYSSVDGVLFNKNKTMLIQYPGGKAGSYAIPGTVNSIGAGAFKYCTGLTGVTIPTSVTTIGDGAFKYCAGLTNITISYGVASIGDAAFRGCTSLAGITVDTGNAVYSSADGVLFNKGKNTLIQYPGGKTGSYTIPISVTSIAADAFFYCLGLTSVTIPNGVTTIENGAFYDCASLSAITVGALNNAYSSVDGILFNKGKTTLIQFPGGKAGSYTVPSSVTTIGDAAFKSCISLTGVTIPTSVATIGSEAFSSCTGLTGITIPTSVTTIGSEAFASCTGLTSVTIPNGVNSIGNAAFWGCTSLTAITVNALNNAYNSVDGVLFDKSKTTLIQYPGGKAGSYTIPTSVTSIGNAAFSSCTSLTGVTIPTSIASIGSEAFSSCTSLAGVTIPTSVSSIGSEVFRGCTSLTAITVDTGNSVYSSLDGVLFDKGKTTLIQFPGGKVGSYTIPTTVTSIGNAAFRGCTSLTGVTIPNGVASIADAAFQGCTSLSAITVDAGNTVYSSLDGVLFDRGRTTLIQCPGGKAGSYVIPVNVTSIGNAAFFSCNGLTGVTIPNTVTSIGSEVFYSSPSLTHVTIPNSVTNIGDYAFYDCASLKGVYFKGNVPGIGSSVFDGDNNATVYYLPGATNWGTTFGGRPTASWNAIAPPIGGRPTAQSNAIGPTIKVNGTAGEITVNYPEAVSVTVEMNAGPYAGFPVDWWVVASAGSSWFYLNNAFQWTAEDNWPQWHPVYQGPLANLPATEVLNITGLLPGSYTFYFAVDSPMDGILNLNGPILVASATVIVQ